MKNNNVLKVRELHNRGIKSELKNFDLLSEFFTDVFVYEIGNYTKFTLVGFDFDEDGFVTQIQPMLDYDLFEVLHEVTCNDEFFGDRFCILHHDLNGFHYIVY